MVVRFSVNITNMTSSIALEVVSGGVLCLEITRAWRKGRLGDKTYLISVAYCNMEIVRLDIRLSR